MISIDTAGPDDVDRFVALESKLFHEDAGRHDTYADVTWPEREGHADFMALVVDPGSLVLVARDDEIVGFLTGYVQPSSATRKPVAYGVLRSLYVDADFRRRGIADQLTERFVSWAREHGCVEAQVDAYVANERAQAFYERHGFNAQSLSRVRPL